ncbi:uncharacterized protein [Dysidea avara]|uniref:uncharacterized protein n=1 Tax=Dysidea avara TaxID=196820 RepID=UPI00331C464F
MAEGTSERNGPISNIMNSLWSNSSSNDDAFFDSLKLTKKQRIIGFFTSLILGAFCFALALLLLPFLILKVRKFVVLFTLGSVFSLGSFSFLWGPWNHMMHLISLERLPFTIAYVLSLAATLWAALGAHSTILTLVFSVIQIGALVWFLVSYIPGGTTGLKFFSKLCTKLVSSSVSSTLDV